jgi:hypothetical protein
VNRWAKGLLVVALVVVVAMAFRVSWNALRDIAKATGADEAAATLYPFVVDGLMALALIATLVLVGRDRKFALRVLAGYTIASLVLNYVHGLVPQLHDKEVDWSQLADWDPANWALVLLATSLPVGSIYFGSDLVAKVLHHQPETATNVEETTETEMNRSTADLPVSAPAPVTAVEPPALPAPATVEHEQSTETATASAAVAAESTRPRRATGRVPKSARNPRPKRTPEELLEEAREATEDWSTDELTAEGIRKAVRTSAEKARGLRDTLRSERAEAVAG